MNNIPDPDAISSCHTISEMFVSSVKKFGDLEAVVDGDYRLSFSQLGERVSQSTSALQALGISTGDRVVIWAPNCWQWIVAALSTWSVGAVVVPVSHRFKPIEAINLISRVGAKALFSTVLPSCGNLPESLREYARKQDLDFGEMLPDLEVCVCFDGVAEAVTDLDLDWQTFTNNGKTSTADVKWAKNSDGLAEIMFTSGTTGLPKGVVLSHRQILQVIANRSKLVGWGKSDRFLLISSYSQVMGLNNGMLASLAMGMTQVLLDTFQPQVALSVIENERISVMVGSPSLFRLLLRELVQSNVSLESLNIAIVGGAPVPEKLIQDIKEQTTVEHLFTSYGMTECSAMTMTRRGDSAQIVASTTGYPTPGLELSIRGSAGEKLDQEMVGEVWVRGYGVMKGYYNAPDETSRVMSHDGWLRTGDLGCLTQEGRLRLMGRQKEMYICYGFNVYPAEIESLLLQSGVLLEAAVISRKSKYTDEEGIAFVVPKPGEEVSSRSIHTWARKNISNYKVPAKIVLCETLPLNGNGKVDKLKLASQIDTLPK